MTFGHVPLLGMKVRLVVCFLAGVFGLAVSAWADEEVCNRLVHAFPTDPLADWVEANRARIATLLSPEEKGPYSGLIASGRCEDAEALIAGRFRASFPEMGCFFQPPSGLATPPSDIWRIYVATNVFPDLGFCFAEKRVAEEIAAFAKANVPLRAVNPGRLWADYEREFGPLAVAASTLSGAVESIKWACIGRYFPACVAYARFAAEGVLVKWSDDRIYYLVVRTRLAGFDDPERARLEAVFGARLTPERREAAEEKARANLATGALYKE
jgi:hypothetical protein